MMSLLNKSIPIPLYYQLVENIRNKIAQNVYVRGQMIPTELQLQEEYGVSRETVRKAIHTLVAEGLIEKIRGKGTFVAGLKIVHRIGSIYGSSDEIRARGMIPTTKFLEKTEFLPPKPMRDELKLNPTSTVAKVRRLRYADNKPVAILTSYIPMELAPGIIQTEFVNGSLYSTLENIFHLTLFEADEIIEAGSADDEQEARLLKIKTRSPVLVVNRLTYLDNMRPIEKLVAIYRSDAFKYQVKLKGRIPVQPLSGKPR